MVRKKKGFTSYFHTGIRERITFSRLVPELIARVTTFVTYLGYESPVGEAKKGRVFSLLLSYISRGYEASLPVDSE